MSLLGVVDKTLMSRIPAVQKVGLIGHEDNETRTGLRNPKLCITVGSSLARIWQVLQEVLG